MSYYYVHLKDKYCCNRCDKPATRIIFKSFLFSDEILYYCEKHFQEWRQE